MNDKKGNHDYTERLRSFRQQPQAKDARRKSSLSEKLENFFGQNSAVKTQSMKDMVSKKANKFRKSVFGKSFQNVDIDMNPTHSQEYIQRMLNDDFVGDEFEMSQLTKQKTLHNFSPELTRIIEEDIHEKFDTIRNCLTSLKKELVQIKTVQNSRWNKDSLNKDAEEEFLSDSNLSQFETADFESRKSKSFFRQSVTADFESRKSKSFFGQSVRENAIKQLNQSHRKFNEPESKSREESASNFLSPALLTMGLQQLRQSIVNLATNISVNQEEKQEKVLPLSNIIPKNLMEVVAMAREGNMVRVEGEDGVGRILDFDQQSLNRRNATITPAWYIIMPNSSFCTYWNVLNATIIFYYTFAGPLSVGFTEIVLNVELEILFTCLLFIDMVFQTVMAYDIKDGPDEGSLETRWQILAQDYLRGWFIIDFLGSFPFATISYFSQFTVFQLLRLLRLVRIPKAVRHFEEGFKQLKVQIANIRLGELLGGLIVMLHWFACSYWWVLRLDDDYEISWAPKNVSGDSEFWPKYYSSFLWAVWVTTGTGFVGEPINKTQQFVTIFCTIIGVVMYAMIIGSCAMAINDLDSVEQKHKARMMSIEQYLMQRQVTPELRKTIQSYFDYCLHRNMQTHKEIFDGLHIQLKREINMSMNQKIILKVQMFRDITRPCLEKLISCITRRIYLPGEWVTLKGEIGHEMFFVASGIFIAFKEKICDLQDLKSDTLQEEPETDLTLFSGDSFGEQALLLTDFQRSFSVQSKNFGELMILNKIQFDEMLLDFPIFSVSLQKWAPHVRNSRGWDKIWNAINLCQQIHALGITYTFEQMMKDINGVEEVDDISSSFDPKSNLSTIYSQLSPTGTKIKKSLTFMLSSPLLKSSAIAPIDVVSPISEEDDALSSFYNKE